MAERPWKFESSRPHHIVLIRADQRRRTKAGLQPLPPPAGLRPNKSCGSIAGEAGRGSVEAGTRVEAGHGPLKSLKSHLLTRARGGWLVGMFACTRLARWTNGSSAEPARRRGVRPRSARRGTGFAFAKDEQSARGAGRIEAGIMTA